MIFRKKDNELLKVLLLVFIAIVLWQLKFVVILAVFSFVLAVILVPFVRSLHKIKLPAIFAVFIPVVTFLSLIIGVSVYVAPEISNQYRQFISDAPRILDQLPFINKEDIEQGVLLPERFSNISQVAIDIGAAIAQGVVVLLTVLVLTTYWLSSYDKIKATLLTYIPKDQVDRAKDIWDRVELKLGRWFVGQVLVSVSVGVMVWLIALILGLPYAGVLGLIAALLEIVPTVGPIIAAVPAILVGLTISLETALIVTAAYVIIQQVESHVLTPMLMGRTVKLHPTVIILGFLSGTILFGLLGGLLSVPVGLVISSFVDSYRDEPIPEK